VFGQDALGAVDGKLTGSLTAMGLSYRKKASIMESMFDESFNAFLDWNGAHKRFVENSKDEAESILKKLVKCDYYIPIKHCLKNGFMRTQSGEMLLPLFTSFSELAKSDEELEVEPF
jgi:hypothetical protein